jgi:hypothetical protein
MARFFPRLIGVTLVASLPLLTAAQTVRVGSPAPTFTATDSNGRSQSLSQ